MPKYENRLSPSAVLNAKPQNKPYKLVDGRGLFLLVNISGSKGWRWKYRRPLSGKENLLSLGTFPEISLKRAREKREEMRAMLADGIDPSVERVKHQNEVRRESGSAFPIVASAWLIKKRPGWAPETHRKAEYVITKYLSPALTKESVATISRSKIIQVLATMPPSLARKARDYLNGIAQFSIDEGLRDESRYLNLRGAVPKAAKGHHPAAVDSGQLRKVVQAIWAYQYPVTRAALKVQLMTGQRPGSVVEMEWAELDLDVAEWSIPAAKMKMRKPHLVPLAKQVVDVLRELQPHTNDKRYVFPPLAKQGTDHLHRDTLSRALREAGLRGVHVPHGGRASLRTIGRERLNMATDVLEAQLAHAQKSDVDKAYVRTGLIDERHQIVQQWADYLESLLTENKVVPLRRA